MKITWVTSEAVPFAKTGGLADVSGSLPQALAERGHTVSVIMPWYPQQTGAMNLTFDSCFDLLGVPFGAGTEWASVRIKKISAGLTFYFIEYNRFFDRPALYDWNGQEYPDNAQRFIFFSRAAMECVTSLRLDPDILHLNDWHCALCAVYLRSALYAGSAAFRNCRSVMSIHNIGYQGNFDKGNLYWTGLGWEYFNWHCLEFYDRLNLLKGGIMCADMVGTVSRTYAQEILDPGFGFALDPSLRQRACEGRLRGILNGIDVRKWDPAADKLLPAKFTSARMTGKKTCKKALQKRFGLPERAGTPLFGILSRLAYQKGLDVFAAALEDMLYHNDFQFVLIGAGDLGLQDHFRWLAGKYPDKFAAFIGYASNPDAHLLEAGSDFFVMPSRYEPCGLNQMYSMRYGTLPIVRHTGGLADTVFNYSPDTLETSTGFVFHDLTPEAIRGTIRWAADVYHRDPDAIRRMRKNGMNTDFSWDHTAAQYEEMYHDAHQ
ncbi:MAG: glycogen synthase GlgA [Lentisphaeria bacterium]|nr:glycogen synthase GlgA [Lentisphaeria bacterium]